MSQIEISKLDVFFISYDEPLADDFFAALHRHNTRAQRVHGVKGFDAAHKEAARRAKTDHFLTIDGDNLITRTDLFLRTIEMPDRPHTVATYKAYNPLNGLEYGNGGVKVWPRETVLHMRTHENSDRLEARVDFLASLNWQRFDEVVSHVHVTATPYQAFRAGFREGVKLSLEGGRRARDVYPDLSPAAAFETHIWWGNRERLTVWTSIGADIRNGLYAIYGARLGCRMTNLTEWDYGLVSDYDWLDQFWLKDVRLRLGADTPNYLQFEIEQEGDRLRQKLAMELVLFGQEESKVARTLCRNHPMTGLLPAEGPPDVADHAGD